MSHTYIKASFTLALTPTELDLLNKACETAEQLASGDIGETNRAEHFAALGSEFAAAFPPTNEDPFSGFLSMFEDRRYPHLDCHVDIDEPQKGQASIYGDQVNVHLLAQLIFKLCKSALPCGFEYTFDSDRLRPGEFGGGYVLITEAGVEDNNTSALLRQALERTEDEGHDGFVLATRDPEHGLSFWNTDTGFGRLATATVFSEAEAAHYDKPIADDEPEWLALPPPLKS